MKRLEIVAQLALFFILVAFPLGVLAHRQGYLWSSQDPDIKTFDLVARSPEEGGFAPEIITVNQGDRVRLRITSADVVHGFAIGRLEVEPVRVLPGKVETIEFTADTPGHFTFYCNAWCSPYHYRMRGTLRVLGADGALPPPVASSEGAVAHDIDAAHEADVHPMGRPLGSLGRQVYARWAGDYAPSAEDLAGLRAMSPAEAFRSLERGDPLFGTEPLTVISSSDERWHLIAYLWSLNAAPEVVASVAPLYYENCAACHGEGGAGDGPASEFTTKPVPDFTDARSMAGVSSETLLAKIRRGGMGTGMPYFGPIYNDQQLQALADYLWIFVFEMKN